MREAEAVTFSISDVARVLGVSRATVWRKCKSGELEALTIGRRILPLRQSVADMIARGLRVPGHAELEAEAQAEALAEIRAQELRDAEFQAQVRDPQSEWNRRQRAMTGPAKISDADPGTAGVRRRELGVPRVRRLDGKSGPIHPALMQTAMGDDDSKYAVEDAITAAKAAYGGTEGTHE